MAFDPNNSGTVALAPANGLPTLDITRYSAAVQRTNTGTAGASTGNLAIRGSLMEANATAINGANFVTYSGGLVDGVVSPQASYIQPLSTVFSAQFENGPCTFFRSSPNPGGGGGSGCVEILYQPPILPGDSYTLPDCEMANSTWGCSDAGNGAVCVQVENGPYADQASCEAALVYPPPEFLGGQCEDKLYTVEVTYTQWAYNPFAGASAPSSRTVTSGQILGAINGISTSTQGQSGGNAVWVVTNSHGGTTSISNGGVVSATQSNPDGQQSNTDVSIVSTMRVDGTSEQDDIAECGNPIGAPSCPA